MVEVILERAAGEVAKSRPIRATDPGLTKGVSLGKAPFPEVDGGGAVAFTFPAERHERNEPRHFTAQVLTGLKASVLTPGIDEVKEVEGYHGDDLLFVVVFGLPAASLEEVIDFREDRKRVPTEGHLARLRERKSLGKKQVTGDHRVFSRDALRPVPDIVSRGKQHPASGSASTGPNDMHLKTASKAGADNVLEVKILPFLHLRRAQPANFFRKAAVNQPPIAADGIAKPPHVPDATRPEGQLAGKVAVPRKPGNFRVLFTVGEDALEVEASKIGKFIGAQSREIRAVARGYLLRRVEHQDLDELDFGEIGRVELPLENGLDVLCNQLTCAAKAQDQGKWNSTFLHGRSFNSSSELSTCSIRERPGP